MRLFIIIIIIIFKCTKERRKGTLIWSLATPLKALDSLYTHLIVFIQHFHFLKGDLT